MCGAPATAAPIHRVVTIGRSSHKALMELYLREMLPPYHASTRTALGASENELLRLVAGSSRSGLPALPSESTPTWKQQSRILHPCPTIISRVPCRTRRREGKQDTRVSRRLATEWPDPSSSRQRTRSSSAVVASRRRCTFRASVQKRLRASPTPR